TLVGGLDAVQHVDLAGIATYAQSAGAFADAIDECQVVRAEHRKSTSLRGRREELLGNGEVRRVGVALLRIRNLRWFAIRSLHEPDGRLERHQRLDVGR